VDERRRRRVLLLSAACSSRGSQPFDLASASCLLLWLRRRSVIQAARVLRARMLSRVFSLDVLTNYDVTSQMRFSKRHIRILASLIPWRETTILGQVRTSRRPIVHRRKRLYACFYRALLYHRELKIWSSDSSAVKQPSTR
jgi:hypothetical protein